MLAKPFYFAWDSGVWTTLPAASCHSPPLQVLHIGQSLCGCLVSVQEARLLLGKERIIKPTGEAVLDTVPVTQRVSIFSSSCDEPQAPPDIKNGERKIQYSSRSITGIKCL